MNRPRSSRNALTLGVLLGLVAWGLTAVVPALAQRGSHPPYWEGSAAW